MQKQTMWRRKKSNKKRIKVHIKIPVLNYVNCKTFSSIISKLYFETINICKFM